MQCTCSETYLFESVSYMISRSSSCEARPPSRWYLMGLIHLLQRFAPQFDFRMTGRDVFWWIEIMVEGLPLNEIKIWIQVESDNFYVASKGVKQKKKHWDVVQACGSTENDGSVVFWIKSIRSVSSNTVYLFTKVWLALLKKKKKKVIIFLCPSNTCGATGCSVTFRPCQTEPPLSRSCLQYRRLLS